jgi:hypothetical protein
LRADHHGEVVDGRELLRADHADLDPAAAKSEASLVATAGSPEPLLMSTVTGAAEDVLPH